MKIQLNKIIIMNPNLVFMKRIVFNSKLNREKFANNKKKFNTNRIIKRQFYSNTKPPEPDHDLKLIALFALAGFCVAKINGRK